MKIHRSLAEACVGLLNEVFVEGRVLDRVIGTAFRSNRKWGKRDRHFIADSVFEVVRWRRALSFLADSDDPRAQLTAVWLRRGYELPVWWEWKGGLPEDITAREALLGDQPRSVRESYPDWLDQRCQDELGDPWEQVAAALNCRAPVFLRVNRLKAGKAEVMEWLGEQGVVAAEVPGLVDGLLLEGKLPAGLLSDPRIEIQDGGSQLIAPFLKAEPGMRVIDACAGAGGKTLHLAALMEGEGEIVALDVSQRRLDELWKRAKRAGLRNLTVERWSEGSLEKWKGWADRLLIDAPCSGLGTLRRQPDLKWRLTEKELAKVIRIQSDVLDAYPDMLKSGGLMVYGTCSILPSENERQMDELIGRRPELNVEECFSLQPNESDFDGFFAARLAKR